MAIVSKRRVTDIPDYLKARDTAESNFRKMGLYIPKCPAIPEELEPFTNDDGEFEPPASATEFDDEQLGNAYSYMNSLAEFMETQIGLTQIELHVAKLNRSKLEDELLGNIGHSKTTQVSLEKAKARRDPRLIEAIAVVNELDGQIVLMERFLNAYDRKCNALSRELTRRGITTARWERDSGRFGR